VDYQGVPNVCQVCRTKKIVYIVKNTSDIFLHTVNDRHCAQGRKIGKLTFQGVGEIEVNELKELNI